MPQQHKMRQDEAKHRTMTLSNLLVCSVVLTGCAAIPSAPGKLTNVDGHMMHLYCTGPNNGSPTVVIIAGLSGVTTFYSRLQEGLERKELGEFWTHQIGFESHRLLSERR
jgi:hypothetical protein